MEESIGYKGNLQPPRWKLHPEDFKIRMAWEDERQRILNLQAKSIEEGLPYPTEKIPPIPELKHPGWIPVNKDVNIPVNKLTSIVNKPEPEIEPEEEVLDAAQKRKRYMREYMRNKRKEESGGQKPKTEV